MSLSPHIAVPNSPPESCHFRVDSILLSLFLNLDRMGSFESPSSVWEDHWSNFKTIQSNSGTWRQLNTYQSCSVDRNVVGKLVEKQNLLWGSNIWQPFGEKWRVSALLRDKEMKISETRSGQKECAYFINSSSHQIFNFWTFLSLFWRAIKERHQCFEMEDLLLCLS